MRIIRAIGGTLAAVILIAGSFFTYQFWPRSLPKVSDFDARIPAPSQKSRITLSGFSTGQNVSPEAVIYSGGSVLNSHRSVYSGFVIEHPKATFLLEGGIGENIAAEHSGNFNAFEQQLFAYTKTQSAKDRFLQADYDIAQIDYIVLTHLHWDHAAVIPDFPDLPVWTTSNELEHAQEHAADEFSIFEEYVTRPDTKWELVEFQQKAYGPFEESYDMFNDGSVVAVPLIGHTVGSMGLFINTAAGKRYFFIGDASWSFKAVTTLSPKIPWVQGMVDKDKTATEKTLTLLHEIWKDNPDIQIIPTHDGPVVDLISQFPTFE